MARFDPITHYSGIIVDALSELEARALAFAATAPNERSNQRHWIAEAAIKYTRAIETAVRRRDR